MAPYTRLYATLSPLRLECPACARLILFGKRDPHQLSYDKLTSILRCPHCGRTFQLGLLVWDLPPRSHRNIPEDTRPDLRQIAEIRNYGRGFWAKERRGLKAEKVAPVNRYVGAECACWPLPWRENCPVHGGQGYALELEEGS
jgi:DNA-directed RNA polymerase subunit RPC12/RpoP